MKVLVLSLALSNLGDGEAPQKLQLPAQSKLAQALNELLPKAADDDDGLSFFWKSVKKAILKDGETHYLVSCSSSKKISRTDTPSSSFNGCSVEVVAEAPADLKVLTLGDLLSQAGETAE